MSIDFDAACFLCREITHLGQIMADTPSFGYGSNDLKGSNTAAAFVLEHASLGHEVRVLHSGDPMLDNFTYVEDGDD